MTAADPKWAVCSRTEIYYRAKYQIVGSPEVKVEEYCRSEKEALAKAETALTEALEVLVKHKIQVEAKWWSERHESRRQSRTLPPVEGRQTLVTRNWHGTFTVCDKAVWESEIGNLHG